MATSFEKVLEALRAFLDQHGKETFYCVRIDAGFIGLDSEEAFEERRKRSAERWEQSLEDISLAKVKACTEEALEDDFPRIHSAIKGSPRRPAISIEEAVAAENTRRAQSRAAGNPCQAPESEEYRELRWQGSASYGELVSLGVDRQYMAHYDMPASRQKKSAYAKAVASILGELERNKDTLFAGVKLSPDFRIYAVEHEY